MEQPTEQTVEQSIEQREDQATKPLTNESIGQSSENFIIKQRILIAGICFFTLGFIITIIFFGGKSTLITLTENTILATPERVAPPKPTPPPLAPQKVIEDLARTDAELATIEQALSAP